MKTIAIQGILGSFHHQVALAFFGENIEVDECMSFGLLSESLAKGKSTAAVMAIENSIAGSIIPNYALIDRYNFRVVGEHYVEIQQHLMALDGQSLTDIKEISSHPMALLQCAEFLRKHPEAKIIEAADTAAEAKRIADGKLRGVAAIAGKQAAERFGLTILSHSIQTIQNNATRFVILNTEGASTPEHVDKASLKFELDHKRGSLAAVLNVLSDCKLNLTKIQSLPRVETPWRYSFFVDVTFEAYKDYEKAKSIVQLMAQNFKVLGEYKNAR